jgi:DnaJ-class molecular chaperone
MERDPCSICGGDGRISNAFGGSSATCPACHGSGRRADPEGFHDVTKTKPSHYETANTAEMGKKKKKDWPDTFGGIQLATEVRDSTICEEELKAKLILDIIDYERTHPLMTKTFSRIIRKQLRPAPPG